MYFAFMRDLTDELAADSKPNEDDELISYLLHGLDMDYQPLVFALDARVTPITHHEVYSMLNNFSERADPAATSEQSQPSPPHHHHPATFMSQRFNLPSEEAPADLLNGGLQKLESTTPVMPPLDGLSLGIPRPEKNKNSCCVCETETLGCNNQPTRSSDSVSPSATLDDAACPPAPPACEAWWKRTFSFLRGNARESLTFRFVFVADKLQLRLEFGGDGQVISAAKEINC
ncbi:hypothetical protein D1007_01355 [Hordeum vulgare]|nr:hypothetical protein D1007_01355 [Hordeum vulgare]